jgi:hypothetical protein
MPIASSRPLDPSDQEPVEDLIPGKVYSFFDYHHGIPPTVMRRPCHHRHHVLTPKASLTRTRSGVYRTQTGLEGHQCHFTVS